tara:strand:- start:2931 stop:3242 length:312 start_codon:yes stop_codon:yes gene_type:complete
MNKKEQNLSNFIDKAFKNITDDRAAAQSLLMSLMKYMQSGDERHREFGLIAAKYLETLQRSNEQLVKIASLTQKEEKQNQEISEKDKQELFDLISKESEESGR